MLDQVDLAAGDQKLLVNRKKIIKVLAKCMTEGNSERANKPCYQRAVLSEHSHWSSVQLYFNLWKHFSGILRKQCAEPACCGKDAAVSDTEFIYAGIQAEDGCL